MEALKEGHWRQAYDEDSNLPWPVPEPNWDGRLTFLASLDKVEEAAEKSYCCGFSLCRLCGRPNGTEALWFAEWEWPAGFRHYVADHGIRPSQAFETFIRTKSMGPIVPRPFCRRWGHPMGFDAADAIEAIVKADGQGPPIGITREQVADELGRLAITDPERHRVVPLSASSVFEPFFSDVLRTSRLFQSGYEAYAERTNHQVVPTTDFSSSMSTKTTRGTAWMR